MTGGIFVIQDNGQLVELSEQDYDTEDLLQELLARYPSLLAGGQIDSTTPRRWLLISREIGLPAEELGARRWSVDHLFLDQDAIPTLIEVKRSTDTRIRREVIGQMLEYAANAVVYWPIEEIRARFTATCEERQQSPDMVLEEFLGPGGEPEQFWQQAKTNLQAGKIRMIFVADEIPSELQRIVEFLNEQMDPAEVLAVEIKQYVGPGLKTLVPRVIGQTAEAQQKKSNSVLGSKQWDEESFFQELEARRGIEEAAVAKQILMWARQQNLRIWWGRGRKDGSFFPALDHKGLGHSTISVWTYGRIEVQFQHFHGPFEDEGRRIELATRLNSIPGITIPLDAISRRPSFPLSALLDEASFCQVIATLEWMIQEIKRS